MGTPPGVRWSFGVPVRVVGVEVAGHQKGLAGSREAEGVVRGVGGGQYAPMRTIGLLRTVTTFCRGESGRH